MYTRLQLFADLKILELSLFWNIKQFEITQTKDQNHRSYKRECYKHFQI